MKKIKTPKNKEELTAMVNHEIYFLGNTFCDLNFIDTSLINMSDLFKNAKFNGDISKWDVSNVLDMLYMFYQSKFTSNLDAWQPLSLVNLEGMFDGCEIDIPCWFIRDKKKRALFLESRGERDIIDHELTTANGITSKNKTFKM